MGLFAFLAAAAAVGAAGDGPEYLRLVGYSALRTELGDAIPVGAGVRVAQVEDPSEAVGGKEGWAPDPGAEGLQGKRFPLPALPSRHATAVAGYFYGTDSLAPGVEEVECYPAPFWVNDPGGILRVGSGRLPGVSRCRIANHSWCGKAEKGAALDTLKRLDYLVAVDDFIQVAGANNGSELVELMQGSYNAIIVGTSGGHHSAGTKDIGAPLYGPDRQKPDLVAPMRFTSEATPLVASAAAMLVGFAHSAGPAISKGSYVSPRSGQRVYHAETSEVIKAALMAGADGQPLPSRSAAGGRRRRAAGGGTGGDPSRLGAGQLNVRNSYHILAAGEQDGVPSAPDGAEVSRTLDMLGFDYNPAFGGAGGSSREVRYRVKAPAVPGALKATLVWNLNVRAGDVHWDGTAELYDLDLKLYDLDWSPVMPVAVSDSWVDNTETVHVRAAPGHTYELRAVCPGRQADFVWDYAIAWRAGQPD